MAHDLSLLMIELGLVVVGLAVLARLASRWNLSAIPLYLIAGLAFGKGGLAPLELSSHFIHLGAEIGVLLLLFMLGLEYTGEELKDSLRSGFSSGVLDFVFNFPPGLIAGWVLGWKPMAAVLLGGVTYISSSGVIAKVLADLRRLDSPETSIVLSTLVIEDLAMAVYLPLVAALLVGGSASRMAFSVLIAVLTVSLVLFVAIRHGKQLSVFFSHESDEIVLLTAFGIILLVAGVAQRLHVSAAIGAFLVGIAVSGKMVRQTHRLLAPFRDFFAATFFFFFGLQIDPQSLVPALPIAALLAVATALTKVLTGYLSAQRLGMESHARLRAGAALVARGEFSIIIAGLGSSLEPQLGPLAAAYVLLLAVLGPILARAAK